MAQILIFTALLAMAGLAVYGLHRLVADKEPHSSSLHYNLGTPCPDGAAASPCPRCGRILGREAAETARKKCESELLTLPPGQQGSGSFIELVPMIWWNIICPCCGEQCSYVPHAKVLLHQVKR